MMTKTAIMYALGVVSGLIVIFGYDFVYEKNKRDKIPFGWIIFSLCILAALISLGLILDLAVHHA